MVRNKEMRGEERVEKANKGREVDTKRERESGKKK